MPEYTNSFDFDCGLFWNLTIFSCYFQSTEKWMSSTSPEKNLALSRLELHSVELKSRGPAKSTPVVENGSSRHILWINNAILFFFFFWGGEGGRQEPTFLWFPAKCLPTPRGQLTQSKLCFYLELIATFIFFMHFVCYGHDITLKTRPKLIKFTNIKIKFFGRFELTKK